MDEAITRPRYARNSLPARRRKKNAGVNNKLSEKIIRQVVLSLFILAFIVIIKNVNTPATNFVTDNLKSFLFQDIDLDGVLKGVQEFLNKGIDAKTGTEGQTTSQGAIVPEKTDILKPVTTGTDGVTAARTEAVKNSGEEVDKKSQEDKLINTSKQKYQFLTPVKGAISSPFGERIHPLTKKISFHMGVDLEANKGDSIKSALDGTVSEARMDVAYGNYIKITHTGGVQTVYGHCSKLLVKKGDKIKQGDVIGKVGDTGIAVGTHLHFEVWIDNKANDPVNFIKVIE